MPNYSKYMFYVAYVPCFKIISVCYSLKSNSVCSPVKSPKLKSFVYVWLQAFTDQLFPTSFKLDTE